jgi:hypothetical protein
MADPTMTFKIDDSGAKYVLEHLSPAIWDEMSTAIRNITNNIKDVINTDYKRSGNMYPSYLNPSPSGLGFTDRTGSLRGSITAWTEEGSKQIIGYVSAGVEYDKYVELLWGGKYSYMLPAFTQNENYILNEVFEAVLRAVSKFI